MCDGLFGRHINVTRSKLGKLEGAIHSTKISGNFGPKLNGSVRSNRKSFGKTGPPFEVVLFSRSDRSEFWLNGSRPERAIFSTRKNAITLKTCSEVYFLRELLSGLLVQNIGRVVTDVTKVSHLA